jgi:LemA protein
VTAYLSGALVVALILGISVAVVIFNGLVALRNEIRRAWSNIDVLLKQRYDEIPRLVEVCKGYVKHEREVLVLVAEARARACQARGIADQTRAEDRLSEAVRSLFFVVEKYPVLKANDSFLKLQARITEIENEIADRREMYNQCVTTFNTRRESFPDFLFAGTMGFSKEAWWRVSSHP